MFEEPGPISGAVTVATRPIRLGIHLDIEGAERHAVAYRASQDGMRILVVVGGIPPHFGAHVDLSVHLPGEHMGLLHGAVTWIGPAGPPDTIPFLGTACAILINKMSAASHLEWWADAVHGSTAALDGVLLDAAHSAIPPGDVWDKLAAATASAVERF